ncbi:UDP-glucose dehydrogenase family protein [Piscibacillus halophilus]|uniref:UDP-glucose 6-dehydrogenase n=1 Tax=Piscibacillus halophilus TaxID=571933 RepID=A0A1H9IQZ6_9BACI|nr:UDP-glucose/GDP-mannose dehydrogenase family protein [Piscibacillus halophilus]SEQ77004.1 UDPglucose 6-dehydrogenase [Piscibacillus halophilus]
MNIAVIGTGYVGLVTGTCLAEIGHHVTCMDIDPEKIKTLQSGRSTIYEPGLEELLQNNIENNRLDFTTDYATGLANKGIVYIAVGTPENEDGSANLTFVEAVSKDIAKYAQNDLIVVTKSTVPVGTNHQIQNWIKENLQQDVNIKVASNPEFLREGSAVYDTFNGDRIVIGTDDENTANTLEEINRPFGVPVYRTDVNSAEMIKYASNAFLATKISFINEIANICEKTGANVADVAKGMGMDDRIGSKFLNAGIGFGGSCFPKDTQSLIHIAKEVDYDFEILKGVVEVNHQQKVKLVDQLIERFGSSLEQMKIAVLGLAFKPNTDDMREAASIDVINKLSSYNVNITAYDPIAIDQAKKVIKENVNYTTDIEEALTNADVALIITEWDQVKQLEFNTFKKLMKTPIIFDGRNCYDPKEAEKASVEYHSIGRPSVTKI